MYRKKQTGREGSSFPSVRYHNDLVKLNNLTLPKPMDTFIKEQQIYLIIFYQNNAFQVWHAFILKKH